MAGRSREIRSDIAWSNAERIVVRGHDLPTEVLGHMDLAAFSFLQLTGRRPTDEQARVDRKSTRLNSSHIQKSRMPSSA